MTAYIFDTETTDSDPKTAQIIEAAWARMGDQTSWHARFQPTAAIKHGAMAVHHIVPEDLVNCPPHTDFRLPVDMGYMIGHNIDFDWQVAGSPPGVKRICTLAMARHIFPHADSHNQTAMLYMLFGAEAREWVKDAHSALVDVENNATLLQALLDRAGLAGSPWEAIWKFSEDARVPQIMTFGKHKGEPIASVPRSYAEWYARQSDPDMYLIEAFKRARKL